MKGDINIVYPESLANSLRLSAIDFKNEIKASALIKLFELGRVSSGTAAKVLGISRWDFLEMLSKYKVSVFDDGPEELNEEIANA